MAAMRMPKSGGAASPVHSNRRSDLTDRSDELIEDALRTNAETEDVAGATLDQLRRQGEQRAPAPGRRDVRARETRSLPRARRLRSAGTTLEDTNQTIADAKGVLHDIGCKIFKEKLWLILIIVMLTAVRGPLFRCGPRHRSPRRRSTDSWRIASRRTTGD